MDIQRVKQKALPWKKLGFIGALLAVISAVIYLNQSMGNASLIVKQEKLVIAKVEQGSFKINVRGTGVLKPDKVFWVSSQVAGRVEEVMVKPGDKVASGEVLARLSNPTLERDLQTAEWELQASRAENHAAYTALESQRVDLENAVVAAQYQYQSVKLRLDAETELLNQGNSTVSQLDYQKSQLAVKQQQQAWQAQQQKLIKMKANMKATKTAQQARLGSVENKYQRILEQVAALVIKAETAGVVQQVPLKLGARAAVGDSVALIADQTSLYAELQVQEARVRDLALGQTVVIDTRSNLLDGSVSRIAPAVSGGMVLVEVALQGQLPVEARPELTVDGLIEVSHVADALYVNRPVFAPRNSQVELYRLTSDSQFAQKRQVQTGLSSVNQIQILSGLNPGDNIVISDTSSWQDHQEVLIN